MIVPFIEITIKDKQLMQSSIDLVEYFLIEDQVEAVTKNASVVNDSTPSNIVPEIQQETISFMVYMKWGLILLYLAGGVLVASHFFISLLRVWQLIWYSPKIKYKNYWLIVSEQPVSSFSWGKYIVISHKDYATHSSEILLHETMHLRYGHTFDLFAMHIFLILYWFNPAIWLLKRELQEIHEFEADNGVINMGIDATRYQLLLVKKAVGTRLYSMVNGFNHSKLKNRIAMMLKKKTKRSARLRLLLFVPLLAGVLYVFARPEVEHVTTQMLSEQGSGKVDRFTIESSLREEFERELEIYEAANGRFTANPNWKQDELRLLINGVNALLFNQEHISLELLKKRVKESVVASRMESLEKDGKPKAVVITLLYDRNTSASFFDHVLSLLKEVRDDVRFEESNGMNGTIKQDKVFPLLVNFADTRYKAKLQQGILSDVVVSIRNKNKENEIREIKDFTIDELKSEINKELELCTSSDDLFVNVYWTKNDIRIGQIDDIKETIREVFRERNTSSTMM